MNIRDRVIIALTPGSPFNANALVWRSIEALAQFAGISAGQTLELLAGDLGDVAVVRPSAKGLVAALKEHVPPADKVGDKPQDEQIAVAGGNAFPPLQEKNPCAQIDLGGGLVEPDSGMLVELGKLGGDVGDADDLPEEENPF